MNNVIDPELKDNLNQFLEDSKISMVLRRFEDMKKAGQITEAMYAALFDNLIFLIRLYDKELKRLKSSIATDGVVTLIDAYNKGIARESESVIDDLLMAIDEGFNP